MRPMPNYLHLLWLVRNTSLVHKTNMFFYPEQTYFWDTIDNLVLQLVPWCLIKFQWGGGRVSAIWPSLANILFTDLLMYLLIFSMQTNTFKSWFHHPLMTITLFRLPVDHSCVKSLPIGIARGRFHSNIPTVELPWYLERVSERKGPVCFYCHLGHSSAGER